MQAKGSGATNMQGNYTLNALVGIKKPITSKLEI